MAKVANEGKWIGKRVHINVGRGVFTGKVVKTKETDGQVRVQVERDDPDGRFKKAQRLVWRRVEQVTYA